LDYKDLQLLGQVSPYNFISSPVHQTWDLEIVTYAWLQQMYLPATLINAMMQMGNQQQKLVNTILVIFLC